MKIVVVDSNILFAALRSANSPLRTTLDRDDCQFFAPNYLIGEIFEHKEKLLKNSKGTEEETYEYLHKILRKFHFVNEELISTANFIAASRLCNEIDADDTVFLALTFELEATFWTRDDKLKSALISKGFNRFFDEDNS